MRTNARTTNTMIDAVSQQAVIYLKKKNKGMPSRNQYLVELMTPAVRDAEERRPPSPAACAWVGKAAQRPWVSLLFAASPRCWVAAGGKQHTRAGARVLVPVPVPSRVQVRARVLVC
jgi:hypothetical protein